MKYGLDVLTRKSGLYFVAIRAESDT